MRDGTVVEAPFALFDEEREMVFGDAVIAAQMALGLVPEILDPIDVIMLVSKQDGVIDPQVLELRDVEHIIAPERVGVDDAIGPYFLANDRDKRV
jgi:hypothetical protein